MKTISTVVYEYDELTEGAKDKARDWFRRGIGEDNFWSECVVDDAKECAKFLGIEIKDIFWSGFSSQGDGACFVGQWYASDYQPNKLTEHAPQDAELARIDKEFTSFIKDFPHSFFSVKHRGHYSHSLCTEFDVDLGDEDLSSEAWNRGEENLKELARDYMQWIYSSLEKEWDYQNSDEVVADNIRANEYTFTEDGQRFV